MVSRKPTKEVELEGRVGAVFDGDLASMGQWSSYAYAGTRQKGYYAQVSGSIVDQDHFDMSDDFSPSPYSVTGANGNVPTFPYEKGDSRDHSDFKDWRVNAKVGLTPNATDEYSINYTNQQGQKDAPLSVDRQIVQGYMMKQRPLLDVAPMGYVEPFVAVEDEAWRGVVHQDQRLLQYLRQHGLVLQSADLTNQPSDSPYDDHSSAASSRWAPTSFR
ncbi:MAG: hypothetical protein WDN31_08560 [Hyphomicrobium sp.]